MLLSDIAPEALPFATLPGAFSAPELDEIVRLGDRLVTGKAMVAGMAQAAPVDAVRNAQTAWLLPAAETQWLYAKMGEIARAINEQLFQFALAGFSDPFQYTIYRAEQGGHYDWHADHGAKTATPRKVSLSLLLSDPALYQGCDLQTRIGRDACSTSRDRGTVIAFPSYVLNRVTPITAGTCKMLVAWAVGPRFQ
jgi:PKHD-type hydroxylase